MTTPEYKDNTMISTFRLCPRKYYLRHVLDWRGKGTALPLSFGLSWHDAMDMVWGLINKTDKSEHQVWEGAMLAFNKRWEEDGLVPFDQLTPDEITKYGIRSPGTAAEMLSSYISQRWNFLKEIELLEIEKPFAVPLSLDSDGPTYIGRLDKVYRHNGRVNIGEHKTTSAYAKATGIRTAYLESYSPNSQVDGYIHAGHMTYGEEMKRVVVDIALVHKTEHSVFKNVPIERSLSLLDGWLGETISWIDRIRHEMELLAGQEESPVLTAFPKNTDACWNYMQQCTYRDVCRFWPNPTQHECPETMEVDKWMPFDILGFNDKEALVCKTS